MKTLLFLVHPAYEKSMANRALIESVRDLANVTIHDLYEAYPDFHIDVEKEKALVEEHERIIWQHPLYWYSSPALLKEWFDVVLQYGWAYGSDGKALHGKKAQSIVTTGGGKDAYAACGQNQYTIEEFLRPMEQTARLCGMQPGEPLVFYQVLNWSDEERSQAIKTYRDFLTQS